MDEFRMFTLNDDGEITNIEVLDSNVVHAILAERERIIKLLEETIIKGGNHGWSISTIIALIKGED